MADVAAMAKRLSPRLAKEIARQGARTYGRLTSHHRPLPDYLIIGTKRGGTTTMWKNLHRHPQVLPMYPAIENLKSPHFFDINFERGERWYRSYFPTMAARSRAARALDSGRPGRTVVGDASPYYMFHPLAAHRVAHTIPGARLVVLLRNPTDRAYSHYLERRQEGTEQLSFRAVLDAEKRRLDGEESRITLEPGYYSTAHDFSSYLSRGRYLEHLDAWLALFPERQILILRSEDFFQTPRDVLRAVFEFLDIDPEPAGLQLSHLNRLPGPALDASARKWLNDYYRPHVLALEARLERSFGWPI